MESSASTIGPRSAGKLLDLIFNIYFKNILVLFGIALAVVGPLIVLQVVIEQLSLVETDSLRGSIEVPVGDTTKFIEPARFFGFSALSFLAAALGQLLIIGAAYRAANDAYLGEKPGAGTSLRVGARKLHSILWVTVLAGIASALGLLALLIGAIFLYIAFIVAVPALMVEDLRGTKALRRSFRLVQDNWWRTFGVIVVTALFAAIAGSIFGVLQFVANPLAEDSLLLYSVVTQSLAGVVTAFTAPLTAVAAIVIYYDLRIRKEGYDVELMAMHSGEGGAREAKPSEPTTPPPPPPPDAG